jgi:hypothetical protein
LIATGLTTEKRGQTRIFKAIVRQPCLTLIPCAIDPLGVAHVQWLQGAPQAVVARRHGDQVDVIGHEATGENRDGVRVAVGLQPFEIGAPIIVGAEHVRRKRGTLPLGAVEELAKREASPF